MTVSRPEQAPTPNGAACQNSLNSMQTHSTRSVPYRRFSPSANGPERLNRCQDCDAGFLFGVLATRSAAQPRCRAELVLYPTRNDASGCATREISASTSTVQYSTVYRQAVLLLPTRINSRQLNTGCCEGLAVSAIRRARQSSPSARP